MRAISAPGLPPSSLLAGRRSTNATVGRGRTTRANLVTLCEDCHSLVHDQYLILQGDAESLVFRKPATRGAFPEATRGASPEASTSTQGI
ncbi:MAG: HNH endonuclease [Planctomycetes bacterium]|nr:HNH endonuclease [Planctomycetota bacterium]